MTWNDEAFALLKKWCVAQVKAGNHEFSLYEFRHYFYGEFKNHDVALPKDGRSWGNLVSTAKRLGLIYEIGKMDGPRKWVRTKQQTRWGIKL